MCYVILMKPEIGLPTVLSQNSEHYPSFVMLGYEEVAKGTKREMETVAEEMIENIYVD